jgi:hypothetical protein
MAGNVASRYGAAQPQQQPMAQMGPAPSPAPSSGGLFSSLGASTPDYNAYLQSNPDVAQWATASMKAPHFTKGAGKTAADYDGDGVLSLTEMARHHFESSGQGEGRVMPGVGGNPQTSPQMVGKPEVNGGARTGDPDRGGGAMNNPLDNYASAGLMAQIAGNAGPNLAGTAQVGQVNPVTGARVGQVDPVTGARVGDVGNVTGASMGSESLLSGLQSYMNPYTNDVVDTTLAGFDTNAARLRAQQAAAGAGRGAFGGSRYAIGEAVTEGELARERASSEAGLRSSAFNTGAALSGQDADRRQQAGAMNAQMDQQARLSNQQSELSRILAQAGFDQQAGLSNQQTDLSRTLSQAGFDQQAGLSNQNVDLSRTLAQANFDQQGGQFNAGQRDGALDRMLSSAGLLTQIGSTQQGNERADIAQIAGLGDTQRGIQQDFDQADLQQLSAITQLLSQLGLGQFIGQTGTQSGTTRGNNFGLSFGG